MIPFAIIVLLAIYMIVAFVGRLTMTVALNREDIKFIISNSRQSAGAIILYYAEHKEALDSLFDMITGEYAYAGVWRPPAGGGIGPNSLMVYSHDHELLFDIGLFSDSYITVPSGTSSFLSRISDGLFREKFYVYVHHEDKPLFSDFFQYLETYGKYIQPTRPSDYVRIMRIPVSPEEAE